MLDEQQKKEFYPLLHSYIEDPGNADKNFDLARFYHSIGQTAAAVGFYIRTAERTQDKDLMYQCMILCARCFETQGNRRGVTVKGMLKHAISIHPKRPEAYLMLAMAEELTDTATNWFDSYLTCNLALSFCDFDLPPLPYIGQFIGEHALLFQKAHTAWWCGLTDESRDIFVNLHTNYQDSMNDTYRNLVRENLVRTNVIQQQTVDGQIPNFAVYDKSKHSSLRHKFKMSQTIEQNYSESYQDMWVLSMVDGKREGTYLEIGSCRPFYGNNTALLEKDFSWRGISLDFDEQFVNMFKQQRKNACYCKDATTVNYRSLLEAHSMPLVIDYLQVDCEPPGTTFEALLNIPFEDYKFRVITYEHDYYADETKSFRDKSRKYLEGQGYVLVADNISPDDNRPYEDWWVHPELIDATILEKMTQVDGQTKMSEKYMLASTNESVSSFDWGLIEKNQWFRNIVEHEVFKQRIYEKFFKVESGDVVFDIGASVGPFIETIKDKNFSEAYVLEPHTELFKTLQKNTNGYPVYLINKAIGATNGKQRINTLFDPDTIETGGNENLTEVDTVKFTTLCKQYRVDHIDFLKMDCEGAEYYIFNDENMQWIKDNVRKIVGEWHLATPEQQQQFRHFRDTYLKQFDNFEVYSFDEVNIKHDLWSDWFLDHYNEITIYIDNRNPVRSTVALEEVEIEIEPEIPLAVRNYEQGKEINQQQAFDIIASSGNSWKFSIAPTMEITTVIPEKGCVVDCVFCPQRTLTKTYTGERRMDLAEFKKAVDKIPKEVRITFAGFVEPWMHKQCTEMVLYAHETGHQVSIFTTGVGMSIEDIEAIKHIPFAGAPNGGFVLHLPDQERKAKHPINKRYIEVVEHFGKMHSQIQNFTTMVMAGEVHESVRHVFSNAPSYEMWSRAGNLIGESTLKPELLNNPFKSIFHENKKMTCGCDERLYHNILLPNGDVSLCCMDYGLAEITGNLFQQDYNDVIPKPYSQFDLCNYCENAVPYEDGYIETEMRNIAHEIMAK